MKPRVANAAIGILQGIDGLPEKTTEHVARSMLTTHDAAFRIRRCDPTTVTDADVAALVTLWRRSYQEQLDSREAPSDELVRERILQGLRAPTSTLWAAFTLADHAAVAYALVSQVGPTRTVVSLYVLCEFRGKGLGRKLLDIVAARLRALELTSFEAETTTREPAGGSLADRLSATPIVEACVQELRIEQCRWDVLRSWLARRDQLGAVLETSTGRYDDSDLPALAPLKAAVRAEYGRVEPDLSADRLIERLRQEERRLEDRRDERWVTTARTPSGVLVGYNEGVLGAELSWLFEETETSVATEWRGRGLGKLIKARLLTDVLRSRPSILRLRTVNLARATGMLATNGQIGYRLAHKYTRWLVQTHALFEYLGIHNASAVG